MDAFINMRDLVVGDNDWYNVTPSVRRAIEGFALILRDHEARLMNGGDSRSPMATARSPSEEFGSSTLEVAQLKDRIARLEEELAVAKRRVAEVTDVAVRAASDAKTAVVEVDAIRPDVDRLANGLSSLHTAVGAHLKDIRGTLANGTPGNSNSPGTPTGTGGSGPPEGGEIGDLTRRVRDLEGDVERIVVGSDGQSAGVARRVAALEDNHKTLERRTRRVERVVEDVRSAEDRRARAEEAERMRELRLGGHAGGGPSGGGGPRRRRGSSSSSSSSEDGREWSSSGRGDDPIAALAGASVSTGLHGGFG